MGAYDDYDMETADGTCVTGICHARDVNANPPPVWLSYFVVPSFGDALQAVRNKGGTVLEERNGVREARLAIIRDPAGAHCTLWQAR